MLPHGLVSPSSPHHTSCWTLQTTDKKVNEVTPELFRLAPDAAAMAALEVPTIESCIRQLGLAPTKAKNLKAMSQVGDLLPCSLSVPYKPSTYGGSAHLLPSLYSHLLPKLRARVGLCTIFFYAYSKLLGCWDSDRGLWALMGWAPFLIACAYLLMAGCWVWRWHMCK